MWADSGQCSARSVHIDDDCVGYRGSNRGGGDCGGAAGKPVRLVVNKHVGHFGFPVNRKLLHSDPVTLRAGIHDIIVDTVMARARRHYLIRYLFLK